MKTMLVSYLYSDLLSVPGLLNSINEGQVFWAPPLQSITLDWNYLEFDVLTSPCPDVSGGIFIPRHSQ